MGVTETSTKHIEYYLHLIKIPSHFDAESSLACMPHAHMAVVLQCKSADYMHVNSCITL